MHLRITVFKAGWSCDCLERYFIFIYKNINRKYNGATFGETNNNKSPDNERVLEQTNNLDIVTSLQLQQRPISNHKV